MTILGTDCGKERPWQKPVPTKSSRTRSAKTERRKSNPQERRVDPSDGKLKTKRDWILGRRGVSVAEVQRRWAAAAPEGKAADGAAAPAEQEVEGDDAPESGNADLDAATSGLLSQHEGFVEKVHGAMRFDTYATNYSLKYNEVRYMSATHTAHAARRIARYLQLGTRPFFVLPHYWTPGKANDLRKQIERLQTRCWERGEGGDVRTFGAERFSALAGEFRNDRFLTSVTHSFMRRQARSRAARYRPVTLVNNVTYAPGQHTDSGGGWHRDMARTEPGIKALMYLDDVDSDTGPFTMLLSPADGKLTPNTNPDELRSTRYNEDDVLQHVDVIAGAAVAEILAPRGSVIVFLAHNVHRGKMLNAGGRVAVTSYYHGHAPTPCKWSTGGKAQVSPH